MAPGELIASRVAVMANGDVAEVVLTERLGPYAARLRGAYARCHSDGAWSAWTLVISENVQDISIAADISPASRILDETSEIPRFEWQEPAALISAVIWVPAPTGAIAVNHAAHRSAFYHLTASGVSAADL